MRGIAFLALAGLAVLAHPGAAQKGAVLAQKCGARDAVASYLEETFSEVPVSLGVQQDGRLVQVFASERTGTWSIVATTPSGVSCIVAVGEAWQMLPTGPVA